MATIYFALNRSTMKAVDMQGWSLHQIADQLPKVNSREQLMPILRPVVEEQIPLDEKGERFLNRMANQLTGIGLPFEMISEHQAQPSEYDYYEIAFGIYDSGWVGHQLSRHLGV